VRPSETDNAVTVESMFQKKEKKILAAPTGKLNTGHHSISQLTNPEGGNRIEEQVTNFADRTVQPFSTDDLKMSWKRYAFQVQSEGRPSLHSTLVKRDPRLVRDTEILFELDNNIQQSTLETEKGELLSFLRKELKNYNIQLELKVIDEEKSPSALYSGMDKYKALLEKNPNLSMLQRMFNLDIEF
jgi:DNA polymerase-3 subunit gamma/tau